MNALVEVTAALFYLLQDSNVMKEKSSITLHSFFGNAQVSKCIQTSNEIISDVEQFKTDGIYREFTL